MLQPSVWQLTSCVWWSSVKADLLDTMTAALLVGLLTRFNPQKNKSTDWRLRNKKKINKVILYTITRCCFSSNLIKKTTTKETVQEAALIPELGHSSPTCNHLPPAFIQVRGNYVPHGYRRALQVQSQVVKYISLISPAEVLAVRKRYSLPERGALLRCSCVSPRYRAGGRGGGGGVTVRWGRNSPPVRAGVCEGWSGSQWQDTPSGSHHWSNVFSRPCQGRGLKQELNRVYSEFHLFKTAASQSKKPS